jgi:hypothetical protein
MNKLHSKVNFNFDDVTTCEDGSHLLEPNIPCEGRPIQKAAISCKMGLEEMTNDDSTSLHRQFDEEPHPPDLISIEVHPTLLSIEGLPSQEIISTPIFCLPSVEIKKVEVIV